jgi:phenylalanyl-tRNA synthetase beta chain
MVDAFDLKAEIELLLERNGWLRTAVETAPHALLHEAVDLRVNGRTLAVVGEVSAPVVRAFGIQRPVFFAEIADDAWMEALRAEHVEHQDVPRFPAVRRDLSVLLDEGVGFAQLEHLVRNAETRLLRQVDLFDVYQGDKLPKGRKSYALSFVLQDDERTLTDEVVEKTMARIREALERGAGAELRG